MWAQGYNPFGNAVLSTAVAGIPIIVLLGSLGILRIRAHYAAFLGLAVAFVIAVTIFGMPAGMAVSAAGYGMCFGLLAICWLIANIIFLYRMTADSGQFAIVQDSISNLTRDGRLQLLLIAFCFGAFFEGAGGGGTPVAITGAALIGLGFSPLTASGLSLIANTAPVAYGGLGTPIIVLQAVTGLDLLHLSGMVGRQLPLFSLIVPFWLVIAYAGWRRTWEVWPAALVAGGSFSVCQFLISNFHGPWLVDIVSALVSTALLAVFLRVWQPNEPMLEGAAAVPHSVGAAASPRLAHPPHVLLRAWAPWVILVVVVATWGLPSVKHGLDSVSLVQVKVPHLHGMVQRVPPVVSAPTAEPAIYNFNWLSVPGTAVFVSAILGGLAMRYSIPEMLRLYWQTLKAIRFSLLTIISMLGLGFVTRYSGTDATLGLAFAHAGVLYPFFGTLLGWLGTALTGTDAASNILFGSLQKITAQQIGLSPLLMAAANSSGGVMGKMIDAQSIVVATTAVRWYGQEGTILRYVFLHSLGLATCVGLLVMLQAYVPPFTWLVR
jgi:lactate permease